MTRKHRISIPLSAAGPQDPKYFDLMKMDTTTDRSIIMAPLPSFMGDTGLHFSFHPSGVRHIRTTNPRQNVDILNLEGTILNRDNFRSFFDQLLAEPRTGYEAFIMMISKVKENVVQLLCRLIKVFLANLRVSINTPRN
jgi:hypothetical protein